MATQGFPCGYRGHPRVPCRCPPSAVQRYRRRISGPLLDRIDLRVDLPAPALDELARPPGARPPDEAGAIPLAERVARARDRQRTRQGAGANARLTADALDRLAPLDADGRRVLARAAKARGLSARAIQSVRRVARTLADLEGAGEVTAAHLARGLALRAPLAAP